MKLHFQIISLLSSTLFLLKVTNVFRREQFESRTNLIPRVSLLPFHGAGERREGREEVRDPGNEVGQELDDFIAAESRNICK